MLGISAVLDHVIYFCTQGSITAQCHEGWCNNQLYTLNHPNFRFCFRVCIVRYLHNFVLQYCVVCSKACLVALLICTFLRVKNTHNEHDGASNHKPHDCLLNRLFRCRSKKTSKLRVTGLCAGKSPETGEFPPHKGPVTQKMLPYHVYRGALYI